MIFRRKYGHERKILTMYPSVGLGYPLIYHYSYNAKLTLILIHKPLSPSKLQQISWSGIV